MLLLVRVSVSWYPRVKERIRSGRDGFVLTPQVTALFFYVTTLHRPIPLDLTHNLASLIWPQALRCCFSSSPERN